MADNHRGLTDVFSDLTHELTHLVRSEMRLARSEMSDKVSMVGTGIAMALGGAVLLMAALVLLLQAAVVALVESGWSPTVATMTVGFIVMLLGALLAWVGIDRMKAKNLVPQHTIAQVKRDADVARHQVRAS